MKSPAVIALLCVCTSACPLAAQSKTLVVRNRIFSRVESGNGFAMPTACDDQGRLYVKLVKPGTAMEGPLLRLSAKGVLEAQFDTTGELTNIFGVRPNGGVVMLHIDGPKVVDYFAPHGKRESSVRLERPPIPFSPSQVAVFRSGEILLAGVQIHPAYKASTAVYDPAGRLVRQFLLDGDAEIERAVEAGDARYTRSPGGGNEAISQSVAITADDGLVYLMRATSPATVYAISSSGEVVRKIVVSPSTDKGWPDFAIRVAKNRLAIKFRSGCDGAYSLGACDGGAVYTVVNATTGKRVSGYEATGDAAWTFACYAPDPDRFFTFGDASDHHHLEVVEAGPK